MKRRAPLCPPFCLPFALAGLAVSFTVQVQVAPSTAAPASAPVTTLPRVDVIGVTPSAGLGIPKDEVPSNVQTSRAADIDRHHALDLADHLNRSLGSVHINETQSNPFQPDVNFRGFTASPLLGTPQGLSVYLDGVRLNQPFGDVVSWDLIPRAAISSITLMPGSNPLFGLNTLGGALAVETKDGRTAPGSSVQILAGSHGRVAAEFETGGSRPDGLDWYATGNRFHERGWRDASPSDVKQLFGKLGYSSGASRIALTAAIADNDLTGNGLQDQRLLATDYASVYTIPDNTKNNALFLNLTASHTLSEGVSLSGHAYFRQIHTPTVNGDANDDAQGQDLYQPNAAERAALTNAGDTGFPTSGETQANTAFPKWRCIADALLNTAPNDNCNGLQNRTDTSQSNLGFDAQLSVKGVVAGHDNQFAAGAAVDASRVAFSQSTQFGYLNPNRSITAVTGPGAFADGTQASDDAYDARVALTSRNHTASVYATDTVSLNAQTHLTLSGRYNRTVVKTHDLLTPGGGPGSLDGDDTYSRFNPAVGLTYAATPAVTTYAGISQGTRAPSAIELGCSDPASPCKLPNSFAGDPPLKQVVTTTVEAGLRGKMGSVLSWNAGVFRSDNKDDLLFVSDNASGSGYFKNFGRTRRQGIELGLNAQVNASLRVGGNYTLLDATYRSAESVTGASNSTADDNGVIQIQPGDRIPLIPRQMLKLYADLDATATWSIGVDLAAVSGSYARGNENNRDQPDGVQFIGSGRSGGYAVLDLSTDYRPTDHIKLFAQIDNLLGRKYATAAQLGGTAFDASGRYVSRPLPQAADGSYPAQNVTFYSPGAPRIMWVGVRYSFGD